MTGPLPCGRVVVEAMRMQAKVIKVDRQKREDRPAYPVVRVWDEAGELLVEVFLGGASMGNAVSRLLSEVPASWSEEQVQEARRMAVEKAVEVCGRGWR